MKLNNFLTYTLDKSKDAIEDSLLFILSNPISNIGKAFQITLADIRTLPIDVANELVARSSLIAQVSKRDQVKVLTHPVPLAVTEEGEQFLEFKDKAWTLESFKLEVKDMGLNVGYLPFRSITALDTLKNAIGMPTEQDIHPDSLPMYRKGKEVSVTFRILDPVKAWNIGTTAHEDISYSLKMRELLGVQVLSWGLGDNMSASQKQISDIRQSVSNFLWEIEHLTSPNYVRNFLGIDKTLDKAGIYSEHPYNGYQSEFPPRNTPYFHNEKTPDE